MSPPSDRSRIQQHGKSQRVALRSSLGRVRIIAGQWRGRKLAVADVAGLRPTGDRVRETLFNWLQASIAGSRCLDLYAGSGALGFEALSRFAASVTFVEPDPKAYQALLVSATALGMHDDSMARVLQTTASQFLVSNQQAYDIVFIDPPFDADIQWDSVTAVSSRHLTPDALIYVESPAEQPIPDKFPHKLCVYREKRFGDVYARLLYRSGL